MSRLAIRGGRVIDPANGIDAFAGVLIEDGRIAAVGKDAGKGAGETIDASGLVVCPGFVDIHTHLREPGFEHKETIESGTWAAARGGFTTVCAMPNTEPPTDSAGAVDFVLRLAAETGLVRVLPIGCVTRRREGKELAELAELAQAGAVAFSDDGSPVTDAGLMRRALEYAGMLATPVIDHCEDPALSGGVMHEGWVATRLGLRGIPAAAEETMVARDIALAAETGSHVHLAHVSTAGSVELIRQAKARGLPVTAEVTPHHLALTHEAVLTGPAESLTTLAYDTNAKVNPPLRSPEDVAACVAGLVDGTIDCIATDHAPHAIQDKLCEFDAAAFGISGLETALSLCLTALDIETAIQRLTIAPVRALGLDRRIEGPVLSRVEGLGSLSPGAPADVALIDPAAEWTVEPSASGGFASKGKNTPLAGRTLRGRVTATVYGGKVVWQA
jgi:dihydroorotase